MSTTGGKAEGVYVVSQAEVDSGVFKLRPGPAIKVVGLQAGTRGVIAGPLTPVFVVSGSYERGVEGGEAVPVSVLTGIRSPVHDLAIPVYVVADDGQFAGGAVPAWTPESPTTDGAVSPLAWWDYGDAATLYTDAGITPVASDADLIYQANDKAGSNHLRQATEGNRPTYKVNIQNGLSVARLDGTADYMTSLSDPALDNATVFAVAKQNSVKSGTPQNPIVSLRPSQTYAELAFDGSNNLGELVAQINNGAFRGVRHGSPSTVFSLATGVFDGDTPLIRGGINGTLNSVIDFGSPLGAFSLDGTSVVTVGQLGGVIAGHYFNGDLCEILIYDGVLSDADIAEVQGYLLQRWDIVLSLAGIQVMPMVRFGDDPVLAKRAGEFDAHGTREIAPVISDTTGEMVTQGDGKIWAYYWGRPTSSGACSIGLAKSSDNGYTWGDRPTTPIITGSGVGGSWYQHSVLQPTVIQRESDGKFLMMATGWVTGSSDSSFGVFSSDDGTTWVDEGQKLTLADFEYSAGVAVVEMGVAKAIKRAAGDYLILFEARSATANAWRIFGATSSDFTGTWTPLNSGLPIFSNTSGWEAIGVANPSYFQMANGDYFMAYNGRGAAWQVGFAVSSDLSSWTRFANNPVLSPDGVGFDSLEVETSFLVKESGDYLRLYYHGFSSGGAHEVGLAQVAQ